MKSCARCGGTFPLADFHGDKSRVDGRFPWCKVCNRAYRKRWATDNPERYAKHRRRAVLKYLYDISPEDYVTLLEGQAGRCAICHEPPIDKALAIDHDHETGVVRGLLCMHCNQALGGFRDDPEILRRAAEYVTSPPAAILTEACSPSSETAQQ